jgi:hypothetical protein
MGSGWTPGGQQAYICIKMGRKAVSMDTKKKIIVLSEVGLSKTVIAERCKHDSFEL